MSEIECYEAQRMARLRWSRRRNYKFCSRFTNRTELGRQSSGPVGGVQAGEEKCRCPLGRHRHAALVRE